MNEDRIATLERVNAALAHALRRTLEEVFTEETPERYSVAVEFDGGDGIVCIIASLSYDAAQIVEDGYRALAENESDGDEA